MNKFLDLLSQGRKTSHSPIGFGSTLNSKPQRQMLLIASVPNATAKSQRFLKSNVDALLFDESILTVVPTFIDQLSDLPWGIHLSKQADDEPIKSNDIKSDFLVVHPSTRIDRHQYVTNTGIFLNVLPNMTDAFIRALDPLPIDGVTVRGFQSQPLTFDSLLTIASVRTMCDKYILVEVQDSLQASELSALCDIGIDGILVNTDTSSINSINQLAKTLDKLPRSKKPNQPIRTTAISSETKLGATRAEEHDKL